MLVLWSVDVVVGFGLPLARVVFDFVDDVCGLFRGVDGGIVRDVPELAEFASMVFLTVEVNRHTDSCTLAFGFLCS
jgi:hypothetical protein